VYLFLFFLLSRYRTSGGNGDPPAGAPNRQVSLANIATAFLTERKSSSRRPSSTRRKKRLATKVIQGSNTNRHSNYITAADEILNQRLSGDNMDVGIATLLVPNTTTINVDNKHRSKTVKIILNNSRKQLK
jgi:hypothetical protein